VATPDDASTVAIKALLLLQTPVPPPKTMELAVYVAVPVTAREVTPVTEVMAAFGLTVTLTVNVVPIQLPVNGVTV